MRRLLMLSAVLVGCSSSLTSALKEDGAADGSGSSSGGASFGQGSGGSDFGSGSGGNCNELTIEFAPVTPTVVVVVDRSGSMFDQGFWQPLYDALMEPSTGVISKLQDEVRFGFTAYTNNGNDSQSACPIVDSVSVATSNYDSIKQVYDAASVPPNFKAETPTGAALEQVIAELAAYQDPNPKYIILATDGEPDTCANPDPQCGQDQSITALQSAYEQGIGTFVIGIGTGVGDKHLADLANAGSGLPVEEPDDQFINTCVTTGLAQLSAEYDPSGGDAPFYQPGDQQALQSTFENIINNVQDCSYELTVEVLPSEAHLCNVEVDGSPLSYETGWSLTNGTVIEITGQACEDLGSADELHIDCPCGAIIVK